MRAYQEQYLDLLSQIRRSSDLSMERIGPAAFLEDVRRTSAQTRQIVATGTGLLREHLFPVLDDLPSAAEDEVAALREFADKLMVGVAQKDAGLAYRIHMALADRARRTHDRDMLIRELYWVGMALHNMETLLSPSTIRLFATRMRMCFSESASYYDTQYDEITDPEIRGYIHRSMGNIALGYIGSDPVSSKAKLAALKRSIALLSDPDVRAKTPSLPWDRYLTKSHQERTTMLSYLRSGNAEPDVFAQVLESAQIVQRQQLQQARDRGEPLQPRWQYAYFAALYHCGAMVLDEYLDALYALSVSMPDDDFGPQSMFSHASIPALYMEYLNKASVPDTPRHRSRIRQLISRMFRWMARVPSGDYNEQLMFYLRQTLYVYREMPGNMSFFDLLQNTFAVRHPTGYARLWRAGQIARTLCRWAIQDCPERLEGLLDCGGAQDVLDRREELLSFAETAGRLYDAGMVHCSNMVTSSCRSLMEEEYSLLQMHAYCGYLLLSEHPSTAPYADIAYGHHCYFNEKGGYPVGFSPSGSPAHAMIYIMAVADAITAATDEAGRHYSLPKPFDTVYNELLAESGTRYAPFVVELLRAPERRKELQDALPRWTEEAYEDLYRRRMDMLS